jgi:hypothetical protein
MGTDIHPAIEVRRSGTWRYHVPRTPCAWYFATYTADEAKRVNKAVALIGDKKHVKAGDRRYPWDKCKRRLPDCFTQRNYIKFAVLADVRNGYGVAGIVTGDPVEPITSGRGLPADITKRALAQLTGDHSETWLTLAELLDYNLLTPQLNRGVITEAEFIHCLVEKRTPRSWSGDVSGPAIVKVTPKEYADLFGEDLVLAVSPSPRTYDPNNRYHIVYEWYTLLKDEVPDIEEMIEYMLTLVPKGGTPNDVRLVMNYS